MDAWPVKESKCTIFLKPDVLEKSINQNTHFPPRCTFSRINYRPAFERQFCFQSYLCRLTEDSRFRKIRRVICLKSTFGPIYSLSIRGSELCFTLLYLGIYFQEQLHCQHLNWNLLKYGYYCSISTGGLCLHRGTEPAWCGGYTEWSTAFVAEGLVSQVHSVELLGHCQLAPQWNCHRAGRDYVILTGSFFHVLV